MTSTSILTIWILGNGMYWASISLGDMDINPCPDWTLVMGTVVSDLAKVSWATSLGLLDGNEFSPGLKFKRLGNWSIGNTLGPDSVVSWNEATWKVLLLEGSLLISPKVQSKDKPVDKLARDSYSNLLGFCELPRGKDVKWDDLLKETCGPNGCLLVNPQSADGQTAEGKGVVRKGFVASEREWHGDVYRKRVKVCSLICKLEDQENLLWYYLPNYR
ncbi:hypothetical protein C8R46DRAFT_1030598 [Mycena filopes]|nr:hypothetical protein C8R46DRAFT_1030598 [Mycena filopes]